VRTPRPEHEKKLSDTKINKTRPRESQIWDQAADQVGVTPQGIQWIDVQDRGADIYEHIRRCLALRHDFVIRAAQNRRLEDPATGRRAGHLFETARGAARLGNFELELAAQPGRAARTATLHVSAAPVRLQAPQRPGHGQGFLEALPCTVIRVFESPAPEQGEALEWILLCRREVTTLDQAVECALIYSTRWVIEEFHKALKTGLGAERLQLESAQRLYAAVALMSVVALRLIRLREGVRVNPKADARSLDFTEMELQILGLATGKKMNTAEDVARALGNLGGHLGRKADGMPGWITLWRGTKKLELLLHGARLARSLKGFG
jgi:hypothetical protein